MTLSKTRDIEFHKPGFGSISTVWPARDTLQQCSVSLKVSRADFQPDSNELKILRYLAKREDSREGSKFVMKLKDDFLIAGPNGNHQCLVTQVAGRRLARPAGVNHACLGPARLLTCQLFQGVEYLHSCNIGHGCEYLRLKPSILNIMSVDRSLHRKHRTPIG